jgi:membrane associated rhomboid family serine protease
MALGLGLRCKLNPYHETLKWTIFGPRALLTTSISASLPSHSVPRSTFGFYTYSITQDASICHRKSRFCFTGTRSTSKASSKPSRARDDERHQLPPSQKASQKMGTIQPSIQPEPSHIPPRERPEPDIAQDVDEKLIYTVHLHRNKQATWSVIAAFVSIYVLGLLARREPAEQDSESNLQISIEDSQPNRAVVLGPSLFPAFTQKNLSYQIRNWPPKDFSSASWMPLVTSMFAHGSPWHLLVNCYGFYQLSGYLMTTPLGIGGTLGVWFFGGIFSAIGACTIEKAYTESRLPLASLLKRHPVDPDRTRTLNTHHLGASGGLMAMMGVVSTWRYSSSWGIPLVPIPAPAWLFGLGICVWDLWGFYNNSPDGIGHDAHLAGMGAGVVMWALLLRKGKYGKAWEVIVRR